MRELNYNAHSKLKKIIRTESNGYPGKGHNSVLSIFRAENRYENLIMLDGDDFLFPHALERINNVKNAKHCDVITLAGNTKIARTSTSFERINNKSQPAEHSYIITNKYTVQEAKNIMDIHADYNKLLIVPFRLLCINRKILDKYEKL
jgi:hypothetical protein